MRDTRPPSPAVIVGIDGSRSGTTAALWAVGEAVERDLPLRLVYAIDPPEEPATHEGRARALAVAETAVRMALVAVESTAKPVKIEVEILQGRPKDVLLEAARGAALICAGATGFKTLTAGGQVGSTAAALATWAHCPVAIIRSYDPSPRTPRAIIAEVDPSADSDIVLHRAIDEAILRKAPLIVVAAWRSTVTSNHDVSAVAEQNRLLAVELNRRLAETTRRHAGLVVQSAVVHGHLLEYLSCQARSAQLLVVGRRRTHGVAEIIGAAGFAALHEIDCSVLVCDSANSL
ncbi:universal stress protein [Mycolicibacterium komossense]|uniref:Universal stress protein n=1 Tax=Mycolicibacterium komossense TaxID=1779 RepID=A0ABT3CJG4_9MYCO|nr:universal stress protein [Mycolicibacterium komossense]MCV7229601.1 universal stress protein [Mycolicibacterium komossense]